MLKQRNLHIHQDEKTMILEIDNLPKMLDLIPMIIVFLSSWTFACKLNVFLSWTQSYASFKNQSNCCVCGHLPVSGHFQITWWISPLQGSNWMALREFVLEKRKFSSIHTFFILLLCFILDHFYYYVFRELLIFCYVYTICYLIPLRKITSILISKSSICFF